PCVKAILLGTRPIARCARIFHRELRLRQLVETVVRSDRASHEAAKRLCIFRVESHAKRLGDFQELVCGGHSYGHISPFLLKEYGNQAVSVLAACCSPNS